MLVHVGHFLVILLSLCCHFGALDDCHVVVMLLSFWSMLVLVVILLSFCCHFGALHACHVVGMLLRILVHVGHVLVILLWFCCHCGASGDCHVVVILLSSWCML